MPTYEYACRDCGEHIEVVQSFRDDPLTVCGHCGGALRKVFSAAGIVFKGSGYYVTDSRKAAARKSESTSESSGAAGESSGEKTAPGDGGTSDAKGDKKRETKRDTGAAAKSAAKSA